MRRICAFLLDLFLTQIVFIFYTSFFTLPGGMLSKILYVMSDIVFFIAYNAVFDCFFKSKSFGKKILGIQVFFMNKDNMQYRCLHGILRLLLFVIFPLTGVYYILSKKMPYDSWFGIVVKEK